MATSHSLDKDAGTDLGDNSSGVDVVAKVKVVVIVEGQAKVAAGIREGRALLFGRIVGAVTRLLIEFAAAGDQAAPHIVVQKW